MRYGPVVAVAATLFAACGIEGLAAQNEGTGAVAQEAGPPTGAEVREYFREVAFGGEYGGAPAIHKWNGPLSIALTGQVTRSDRAQLERVVKELRRLTGLRIEIGAAPANVIVSFVRAADFGTLVPGAPAADGYVTVHCDESHVIRYGAVLIATDATPARRAHAIGEELAQLAGLMRDSMRFPSSIFYEGESGETGLAEIDRLLLALLYRPEIRPGMTPVQVEALLGF